MIKFLAFLVLMLFPVQAFGLTSEEITRKSQEAFLYQGSDFKARVLMKLISKDNRERVREMTMLRKNFGPVGGEQKYFMYFHQPAEVRRMSFMVYKYPGRDDDRWLFLPAINMTRRIAARDKTSSFVGSDFTYEDISGRDIEDDTYILEREERVNGNEVYVVRSTPKADDVDYRYKLSWIDKKSFLPLREEYYDIKGDLIRVFTADKIEEVKEYPTVVHRTMKNVQSGHRTEVSFLSADYNISMDDELFSERFLKRPPQKWINQ